MPMDSRRRAGLLPATPRSQHTNAQSAWGAKGAPGFGAACGPIETGAACGPIETGAASGPIENNEMPKEGLEPPTRRV